MTTTHTEREIKLRRNEPLEPGELDSLLRSLGVEFRVADTVDQQDEYLDDSRLSLARAGFGLRLRTIDQRGSVLGWKSAGTSERAAVIRQEMEQVWEPQAPPGRAGELPTDMRHQVEPFTLGRPLSKALRFTTRRHQRVLHRGGEAGLLALDRVRAVHGERAVEFTEVEIELPDPHAPHWDELASVLCRNLRLEPVQDSKLQHGLLVLRSGEPEETPLPLPGWPLDRYAWSLLRTRFRQMQSREPGVRADRDPEELHKFRVAARRMRSLLRTFSSVLPEDDVRRLVDYLRELGRLTGPVRDLDVQKLRLEWLIPRLPPRLRGEGALLDRLLDRDRKAAFDHLARWLVSSERLASLTEVEEILEAGRRGDGPIPTAAGAAAMLLNRELKRVNKRGRRLHRSSPAEDFHSLRIACKRLRYTAEDLLPAWSEADELRAGVRRTRKLQELLGEFCDHDVAAGRWLDRGLGQEELPPAAAMALGAACQTHRQRSRRLRARVAKAFRKLRQAEVWKAVKARCRVLPPF